MPVGNIMNLFNANANAPAPVAAPATVQAPPAVNGNANPDGSTPAVDGSQNLGQNVLANQQTGNNGQPVSKSPLAAFEKLFETVPVDDKNPLPVGLGDAVFGNADPAKIAESLKNLDLASNISPELIAKLGIQDPAALNAVLNANSQNLLQTVLPLIFKSVDQAVGQMGNRVSDHLPKHVRQTVVADKLLVDNPQLNNPAILPVVTAIQQQVEAKFPNASPAEVQAKIEQYLAAVGMTIGPRASGPEDGIVRDPVTGRPLTQVRKSEDFENFFRS